jgi:signal peptidase II
VTPVAPLARASGLAALVAVATVALDQAVEAAVRARIAPGARIDVFPGVHLVRAANPGVAFGLFAGGGVLLILVGAVALAALLAFFVSNARRPWAWLPTGLLIGGAAGNLIDRLRDGAVTDYVQLPHWPAFNVADVAITFGVIALVLVLEASARRARA